MLAGHHIVQEEDRNPAVHLVVLVEGRIVGCDESRTVVAVLARESPDDLAEVLEVVPNLEVRELAETVAGEDILEEGRNPAAVEGLEGHRMEAVRRKT